MEREFSQMTLLVVLHVLAKQGKIDPAQFIKDFKEASQRFVRDFTTPINDFGPNPANEALAMFENLIEYNLPLPFNDNQQPGSPQKPPRK